MDMDLSPKFATNKISEGEGGSYSSWSTTKFPLLGEANVGGGLLVLKPGGFVLPHYADSSKIAYVLEGENGSVGIKLATDDISEEEKVLSLRTGDVIPMPIGAVSWWYNDGNSDFLILFLGETSKAYISGEFSYFLLTGAQGILRSFSTEFTRRAYKMNDKEANVLANSQTGLFIVKLGFEERKNMPRPHKDNPNKWVKNFANFSPDVHVEKAGTSTSFSGSNFDFLEEVGLSCSLVKLEANAILSPMYAADSSVQVFYVAKGSGKVQIVGINSKLVLDNKVVAGQLFIVPRFFVVSIMADGEGIECFYIITTARPAVGDLASKHSVLHALSSSVLQSALNVTADFARSFKRKMSKSRILIPPMN